MSVPFQDLRDNDEGLKLAKSACPACPVGMKYRTGACPVAPADGTGVAPADGTGVKFL